MTYKAVCVKKDCPWEVEYDVRASVVGAMAKHADSSGSGHEYFAFLEVRLSTLVYDREAHILTPIKG